MHMRERERGVGGVSESAYACEKQEQRLTVSTLLSSAFPKSVICKEKDHG